MGLDYTRVRSLGESKAGNLSLVRDLNTKEECYMRTVYCYDKKKYPKLESKAQVFYLNNLLRKSPIPQLPLIYDISAFKEPIQVVEQNLSDWRSLRYY